MYQTEVRKMNLRAEFYGVFANALEGVIAFAVHVEEELVIFPKRLPMRDREKGDSRLDRKKSTNLTN